MNTNALFLFLLLCLLACFGLFQAFQNQMTALLFDFGTRPAMQTALAEMGVNLKKLSALDADNSAGYREQFEKIQELRRTINVMQHSRTAIMARFEQILLLLFAGIALVSLVYHWFSHRRAMATLQSLALPLEELAAGNPHIHIQLPGRGLVGRVAGMIERTSRAFNAQQIRLRHLENLENWQEGARRQAHEIKRPITAALMELERLMSLVNHDQEGGEIDRCYHSLLEEMNRLNRIVGAMSGFARVGRPDVASLALQPFLADFTAKYAEVWPNLRLVFTDSGPETAVLADRYLTRQVLVNLCENSAAALGPAERGEIRLEVGRGPDRAFIDIADNGPGIASSVLSRLFQPYATTRELGEGMGLGLAICKKIMLEQGGDLELQHTGREGTVFRLTLAERVNGVTS